MRRFLMASAAIVSMFASTPPATAQFGGGFGPGLPGAGGSPDPNYVIRRNAAQSGAAASGERRGASGKASTTRKATRVKARKARASKPRQPN